MPNPGRSHACDTCKEKRVRCDGAKPTCQKCLMSKWQCKGYTKPSQTFRFRDQTSRTAKKLRQSHRGLSWPKSKPTRCTPPPLDDQNALCFFLTNYATAGRDFQSTRGFFEYIAPVLSVALPDAPSTRAATATALLMYNNWRRKEPDSCYQKMVADAYGRLQRALQDPIESKSTDALLATLLLQFHDNISAVKSHRKVSRTHQNGALALARHLGFGKAERLPAMTARLCAYVRHTEVAFALRESLQVPDDVAAVTNTAPFGNISFQLDTIGAMVANLQFDVNRLAEYETTSPSNISCKSNLFALRQRIERIDFELEKWVKRVPKNWYPHRLSGNTFPKLSPWTYKNRCDIYPSIQIASIWNTIRGYQLIMLQTSTKINTMLRALVPSSRIDLIQDDLLDRAQTITDAICCSVPFYIGTRQEPSTITDLNSRKLVFPAYHSLAREYLPVHMKDVVIMGPEEHQKHVVAQGAWHALTPLSQVVNTFSGDTSPMRHMPLRPGQLHWIESQLFRVAKIMRLPYGIRYGTNSTQQSAEEQSNLGLAQRAREGLRLTTGA